MAGRIRLAVTGIQDQWLTGEPQFSYFVMNYKRHTRFSTEAVEMPFDGKCDFSSSVECRIPQNIGDLIRSTMLKIKLGKLSTDTSTEKYRYNTPAALSIIKYVDLVIGGQIIERLTGDYIYMYNQLHNNKDDVNQSLYILSGHGEHLQVSDSYNTFYVNIPFYFFRNPSLAVPVCAITKQLVEVRVTFKDINDDVTFKYTIDGSVTKRDKTTEGSIDNVSLITDFYFVAEEEKNFLLTRPMEYIISQLQMSKLVYKPNESKKSALLKFKHPVKELFFSAKEKTGTTNVDEPVYAISQPVATINAPGGSVISNNGLVAVTYDNSSIGEVKIFEKDSGGNWPSTASATYTGPPISVSNWTQMGQDIDAEAAGDRFGYSVSMSSDGTRVAIGAPYNDAAGATAGHVRVYDWNSATPAWEQVGQDIDGEAAGDRFGYSVSMSSDGTRVAIGAPGEDFGGGATAGHVRVYDWNSATPAWEQVGQDIDGEAAGDQFGHSVSMSSDGTRVAIGAPCNDGTGNDAGHVRVYDWNSATPAWEQVGQDIDGEVAYDQFGYSVSMSSDGTRVAIGGPYNDGVGGVSLEACGHVRIFEDVSGTWTQMGQDIDGELTYDASGQSVSMSSDGTRVAIGARFNNSDSAALDQFGSAGQFSGHVRVYDWNSATLAWEQVGQDIDGEVAYDQSGWSVSMSSDGTRLAIGAPYNDAQGNKAGHVRVYDWNSATSAWEQVGLDIDGEAANDESGLVSISGDGTRLAIGAPFNDGTGTDAGHVRVYSFSSSTTGEYFGRVLGVSDDGTRVAMQSSSKMMIVEKQSSVWTQIGSDITASFNAITGSCMSGDGTKVFGTNGSDVYSWEYSSGSWSQYRYPTSTSYSSIGRISHSTNGEILGIEDIDYGEVVIFSTTSSSASYSERHVNDYFYTGKYHSLSNDGANLIFINRPSGSRVWNESDYVYDGAGGTQVPWYTTSISSFVEISRNGNFVFWNDSSSNRFKLYSKSVVDGNVQWTLKSSIEYFYTPVKMSALGSDAIIVTGSGSVGAKIHDITATPGDSEDRLLNISSSDQEFTTLLPGKRSDHRLIKNVKFACNGETIFDQSGQYLAYEQSLRHHTGCPDPAFEFYSYSFSLKPEQHYPSGQLNMSRIIHKKIDIELEETSTTRDIDVSVYALNYNVLHVASGLVGLKF